MHRRSRPRNLLTSLGLRILVADDNAAVRHFITHTLDEWGAHATEVGSVPEVLRELRSTAYNAIVIDHSLLDEAAIKEFQSVLVERAVRPRVIRLATFTNLAHAQNSDVHWFDAEITKPVRLTQLQRILTGETAKRCGAIRWPSRTSAAARRGRSRAGGGRSIPESGMWPKACSSRSAWKSTPLTTAVTR